MNESENSQEDYDFQEDLDEDEDFVCIDIGDIFEKYYKEREILEATTSDSSDDENIAATNTKRIKLPKHIRCSCHLLNLIAHNRRYQHIQRDFQENENARR